MGGSEGADLQQTCSSQKRMPSLKAMSKGRIRCSHKTPHKREKQQRHLNNFPKGKIRINNRGVVMLEAYEIKDPGLGLDCCDPSRQKEAKWGEDRTV